MQRLFTYDLLFKCTLLCLALFIISACKKVDGYDPFWLKNPCEHFNLIKNGNFKSDFDFWAKTENLHNICLKEAGTHKYVEIEGDRNQQYRLWQTISTVSGHVYRLSFKLKTDHDGAFAIIRDDNTKNERYFYPSRKNGWNNFCFDINEINQDKYRIFLSCQGSGKFCFSDVALYDKAFVNICNAVLLSLLSIIMLSVIYFFRSFIRLAYNFLNTKLNDYLLFLFVPLLFYLFLGWHNSIIFILWWLYFSSIHFVLWKRIGCPVFLVPLLSIALIVLTVYITGMLGIMQVGYCLLAFAGIFSLFYILYSHKIHFWKAFVFQPKELWIYYILALILFIQNILFSNGVTTNDDKHHWLLIIKGMFHYNSLSGFPMMNLFKNYTLGQATWGYFINKLLFNNFRIDISYWSNSLIFAASFIPGLQLLKLSKNRISLISIILLLFAFILFVSKDYSFYSLIPFVFSFIFVPKQRDSYFSLISFCIYFIFYSVLLILPNIGMSNYRNLSPDILIFAISISCYFAYLSSPTLRTIFWISPILILPYIYKTPGLFLSVTCGLTIIIHFVTTRFKLLLYSFVKKRFKIVIYTTLSFICIIFALIVPVKVWNSYCNLHNYNKTSMFKIDSNNLSKNIAACFFDDKDPQFYKTRTNFLNKFKNDKVFDLNFNKDGFLSLFLSLDKFFFSLFNLGNTSWTYPKILIVFTILGIIASILLYRVKFKGFFIILLFVLLFTLLHIAGVLVNYCLMFTHGSERFTIPDYSRYSAPMLKIFLMIVLGGYLIFINDSKKIFGKTIVSLLFTFFTISVCIASPLKIHYFKHQSIDRERFSMSKVPSIDFINKRFLVIGSQLVSRPFDKAGMLFLSKCDFCPSTIYYYCLIDDFNKSLLKDYDYILWLMEDIYDSNKINKNLKDVLCSFDYDEDILQHTCLFEIINSNNLSRLNPIYYNAFIPSNVLLNADFKSDLSIWRCSDPKKFKVLPEIHGVRFLSPKTTLSQFINLKKDNHYIVKFNLAPSDAISYCGSFGSVPLYSQYVNGIRISDTYLSTTNDVNLLLKLFNHENPQMDLFNLNVIDLGE